MPKKYRCKIEVIGNREKALELYEYLDDEADDADVTDYFNVMLLDEDGKSDETPIN